MLTFATIHNKVQAPIAFLLQRRTKRSVQIFSATHDTSPGIPVTAMTPDNTTPSKAAASIRDSTAGVETSTKQLWQQNDALKLVAATMNELSESEDSSDTVIFSETDSSDEIEEGEIIYKSDKRKINVGNVDKTEANEVLFKNDCDELGLDETEVAQLQTYMTRYNESLKKCTTNGEAIQDETEVQVREPAYPKATVGKSLKRRLFNDDKDENEEPAVLQCKLNKTKDLRDLLPTDAFFAECEDVSPASTNIDEDEYNLIETSTNMPSSLPVIFDRIDNWTDEWENAEAQYFYNCQKIQKAIQAAMETKTIANLNHDIKPLVEINANIPSKLLKRKRSEAADPERKTVKMQKYSNATESALRFKNKWFSRKK